MTCVAPVVVPEHAPSSSTTQNAVTTAPDRRTLNPFSRDSPPRQAYPNSRPAAQDALDHVLNLGASVMFRLVSSGNERVSMIVNSNRSVSIEAGARYRRTQEPVGEQVEISARSTSMPFLHRPPA